jgi:hypothetical protein
VFFFRREKKHSLFAATNYQRLNVPIQIISESKVDLIIFRRFDLIIYSLPPGRRHRRPMATGDDRPACPNSPTTSSSAVEAATTTACSCGAFGALRPGFQISKLGFCRGGAIEPKFRNFFRTKFFKILTDFEWI